jgi:hypothetical protein
VGAYGLPTTHPVARVLLSPYPPQSRDLNDDRSRSKLIVLWSGS